MTNTIVVTPTYNERENLEPLVRAIWSSVADAHVLVVDDNSPDGTGGEADRLRQAHPDNLFVMHRAAKMGLGRAYVAGFGWALDHDYRNIVQMDADLSHDAAELPAMIERLSHADLVIGSRYVEAGSVVNWDLKRRILSKAANRFARVATGVPLSDGTSGFRCWTRHALEGVSLESVSAAGYLFQIEMACRAYWGGFEIAEHPITFHERRLGKSKLDVAVMAEACWGVLTLRRKRGNRQRL